MTVFQMWILLCVSASTSAESNERRHRSASSSSAPSTSLFFKQEGRMIMTGRNKIIALKVDIEEVLQPLHHIREKIVHVDIQIRFTNTDKPKQSEKMSGFSDKLIIHIKYFLEEIKKLETHMKDFFTYMLSAVNPMRPNHRGKRGAINILGTLANALFGVATQKQVNDIHAHINNMEDLSEKQRNQLNVHTDILNITVRKMTLLTDAVSKLEKTNKNILDVFGRSIVETAQLEHHIEIMECLMSLQLILNDIARDNQEMIFGLREMMEGKLSQSIVPTTKLVDLLQLADFNPLYPPTETFIGFYYKTSHVTMKSTNTNAIVFYIALPMKGDPGDVFDIYRIHPLPVPVPDSQMYLKLATVAPYLAITETRRLYAVLHDVNLCSRYNELFICPPGQIYDIRIRTCELSLFTNNRSISELCMYQMINEFPPYFVATENGWTYASREDVTLHLRCDTDVGAEKEISIAKGLGKITVASGCSVNSDQMVLPATILEPSDDIISVKSHSLEIEAGVIAKINDIKGEIESLMDENEGIQDLLKEPHSLEALAKKLKKINRKHYESKRNIIWIIVVTTVVVIILVGLVIGGCVFRVKLQRLGQRWVQGLGRSQVQERGLAVLGNVMGGGTERRPWELSSRLGGSDVVLPSEQMSSRLPDDIRSLVGPTEARIKPSTSQAQSESPESEHSTSAGVSATDTRGRELINCTQTNPGSHTHPTSLALTNPDHPEGPNLALTNPDLPEGPKPAQTLTTPPPKPSRDREITISLNGSTERSDLETLTELAISFHKTDPIRLRKLMKDIRHSQ